MISAQNLPTIPNVGFWPLPTGHDTPRIYPMPFNYDTSAGEIGQGEVVRVQISANNGVVPVLNGDFTNGAQTLIVGVTAYFDFNGKKSSFAKPSMGDGLCFIYAAHEHDFVAASDFIAVGPAPSLPGGTIIEFTDYPSEGRLDIFGRANRRLADEPRPAAVYDPLQVNSDFPQVGKKGGMTFLRRYEPKFTGEDNPRLVVRITESMFSNSR